MNKSFSYYFKEGLKQAGAVLKGSSFSSRFNLLIYFLMSFLGKLFFFSRPIFLVADCNVAKMAVETNDFSFEKAFSNCCDLKRYLNLLTAGFIIDFILITGIIFFLIPVLLLVGYLSFYYTYNYEIYIIIVCCITVPFALGALIYLIYYSIVYSPIGYIIANNKDFDVSDLLLNSKIGMRGSQFNFLLINICYFLLIGFVYSTLFISFYYLITSAGLAGYIVAIILLAAIIICSILYLQVFFLGNLISNYEMISASVRFDKVVAVKSKRNDVAEVILSDDILDEEESDD